MASQKKGGKGMELRLLQEELEERMLGQYAVKSVDTKGRQREEPKCDIRTDFQRDRDRILHCKSFRRMKHKTQVFISPEGDHYRTRLTHTLEVSQNARTIAKALQLNEELVEAIALGHDLGHTPFGHAGERALNEICPYGFRHNEQSVRTVDILEKNGSGLNLTWEVRDGIENHQTKNMPSTLEGKVVRFSDKIAYTYHDMDDAIRAGILKPTDVPREIGEIVGYTPRERLNKFIHDIVTQSKGTNDVRMSEEVERAMRDLRSFMFDKVYSNPIAKGEEEKAVSLVKTLYEYYMNHTYELPKFFVELGLRGEPREQVVCDYISSMTDRFAISLYNELYVPKFWMG